MPSLPEVLARLPFALAIFPDHILGVVSICMLTAVLANLETGSVFILKASAAES